ncbi:hypothetical protein [Natrinema salaciae]|uniref:Uncharacterized protein n=1 Tax=Natrinema salaciae TaxID=1186196 RepID=A0A1H9EIG1_9EURY|nr:hypothetical protein [Natrinema salaciae]SEQ25347.1 hypothetical protein SAMN04489841_1300 [Natrinema salaciae]
MTSGTNSRRRFLVGLAAVGGVSVAGCTGLPWRDAGPTFTAADAAAVIDDGAPPVEWPVPVRPAASAVDEGLERIDALLADVPDPIEAEMVPNGVIRKEIERRRDEARDHREEAAGATGDGRYGALRTTREGRDAARAATTTLAAIEDETLVEDLRAERNAIRGRVDERRDSIAYRGGDADDERLRAALYYSRLESDLRHAAHRLHRPRWALNSTSTVVEIGEGAGALESATATTAAWDHLADRYAERTDDATDLTPAFDAALELSIDRTDAADIPDQTDEDWHEEVVDEEFDDLAVEQLLWRVLDPVSESSRALEEAVADGARGTGLYESLRFELTYRAFERVRDRIADGALPPVESVDEIRAERAAALDAAASTDESLSEPSIGAYVFAETLQSIEWVDDAVRRAAANDSTTAVSLTTEFAKYAHLRGQLEVLPDAVAAFRERLLAA